MDWNSWRLLQRQMLTLMQLSSSWERRYSRKRAAGAILTKKSGWEISINWEGLMEDMEANLCVAPAHESDPFSDTDARLMIISSDIPLKQRASAVRNNNISCIPET